jgi:hypothetical protein
VWPFHSYDSPSVFGPNSGWDVEWPTPPNTSTHEEALDVDAEATNLPLGLLDLPPHQDEPTEAPSLQTACVSPQATTAIQHLCSNLTAPPPRAILPTLAAPSQDTPPPQLPTVTAISTNTNAPTMDTQAGSPILHVGERCAAEYLIVYNCWLYCIVPLGQYI